MGQDKNFHLYLLVGQSNMAGRGEVEQEDRNIHLRVLALNKSEEWMPAADPIHFDKPMAGVGPGVAFGKAMADNDLEIRVGLIPCAAGGSPIISWQAGGYWGQTDSHPYDDAIKRTKLAMESGILKGIIWHQGESDSNEDNSGLYESKLADLIKALRQDLNAPKVPFIAATISDFANPELMDPKAEIVSQRQIVNAAIRNIPKLVKHTAYVESTGLKHKGDNLHFDSASSRELGRRYAKAMIDLQRD